MLDFAEGIGVATSPVREGNILMCEPDVVRLFGAVDIGAQGQVDGWAEPEEGHVWNDGPEATLLIGVPAPTPRLLLSLGGEPYVSRVRPTQEVTVFGNGLRLHFRQLARRAPVTLAVALEPEWWLRRGRLAVMRLSLHLPLSVRPCDIADGPDGRALGFCLRSICLQRLPDISTDMA